MSAVAQAYVQAQTAIAHAKSLFAADPLPPTAAINSAATLSDAHESAIAALSKTAELSGETVTGYRDFAASAAAPLSAAAKNDARLGTLLQEAAEMSQTGSAQLESLYQQLLAMRPRVAAAKSAPAQRAAIAELNSYVRQADQVVKTANRGANSLTGQIRALQYPGGAPGTADAGGDFDLDTQYVRPASYITGPGRGPVPESGYECVTAVTGVTMTVVQVTQTKTWWTQAGGSDGKHCK
nr:hypothetical protein ICEMyc226_00221 [Mycolicibacterium sp.]